MGLEHATVAAPSAGEVSRRLCEPGDLAWPGKPLLSIQSEGTLRLEASVREALIGMVPVGTSLEVEVPSVGKRVAGTVHEVVPSADAATRSFLVKVRLMEFVGLYPGMFGKAVFE